MKESDIEFLREFLKRQSGIVVTAGKTYLFENRLAALVRRHGLVDLEALVDLVRRGERNGLDQDIVEAMTTNESFFFRDMVPFEILRDAVLPALIEARQEQRTIRIWCAACATGQEPYSIAMTLQEADHRLAGRNIEIVATDLDRSVLARARSGVFTQFEVQRGLPVQYLMTHFTKEGERWRIGDHVRRIVEFREHNLMDDPSHLGRFDVVFCRNVLIYFDADTKAAVLDRLARQMPSDGALFLGGAETVLGVTGSFTTVPGLRGVYRPAAGPSETRLTGAVRAAGDWSAAS